MKKVDNLKKKMITILLFEIIIILVGFMYVLKPKAQIITQRPNLSSDYGGDYSNQVIEGIRWHLIGGSPVITTLYAYYDYRMSNLDRRYTLSFWVYSQGSTPYVTINGQPCNTLPNDYQIQNSGNYNAYEQVQGYTWLINCPNIAPDPDQFYVRIGNIKSSLNPSLQGIGANFYVDSYPSESSAINGAVSQIQQALIENNNTNTNHIVTSVNNMTSQLLQKQNEWQNQDLDEGTKQNANTEDYTNYKTTAQQLRDISNNMDINNVSIGIDGNTNLWIWTTMTRLLNSHSLIMGTMLSLLSVGIIKLMLRR